MATTGGRTGPDLTPGGPAGGNPPIAPAAAANAPAGAGSAPAAGTKPGATAAASKFSATSAAASASRSSMFGTSASNMAALAKLLPGLDPKGVATRLFTEPFKFDFFQSVRILERLFPDTMPVGFDGPPGRETVRFRSHVSLIFPPSQIWDLRVAADRSVPEMDVTFFGMVGPSGIMPRHLHRNAAADSARREAR